MTLKVRIFLNPPSGCSCGNSQQDSTIIRCFIFINNLKSQFGDEVDIETIFLKSDELDKYHPISKLKAKKKLKTPIVLVNDAIKSIGRFPSEEEISKG